MKADAYERERRMVERGAALPETAAGLTSGDVSRTRGHFDTNELAVEVGGRIVGEAQFHAERAYPDCADRRFLFVIGWRRASEGLDRCTLFSYDDDERTAVNEEAKAKGWDTYREVRGLTWGRA